MDASNHTTKVDALVIGGGIGGLQAAVDLADQGLAVMVVEREASIGGTMIALSKVFPTLDCSSCITTPKMAEAAHHPGIDIRTYTEIEEVSRPGAAFRARLKRKPRYVREEDCIGCRQCEYACPIYLPDAFERGQGASKAIAIPHSNAMPQYAVLDMDSCTFCGKCIKACPTDCIEFDQTPTKEVVEAGTVILATGFGLTPLGAKSQYGGESHRNVVDPLFMERVIAPHGPYGKVLRPSDGRIPDTIAYVQCAGSRDKSIGVPYCSRVCCMYALKQAVLVSGSLPFVEVSIFYMDIRAFGKGFEQFYQEAKAMGIELVQGKVATIREDEDQNLVLRVENKEENVVEERTFDMVVLSLGMQPGWNPTGTAPVDLDRYGFIACTDEKVTPATTTHEGIYAAGTATAPKDIVDTIVEAGAAAMQASRFLQRTGWERVGR